MTTVYTLQCLALATAALLLLGKLHVHLVTLCEVETEDVLSGACVNEGVQ